MSLTSTLKYAETGNAKLSARIRHRWYVLSSKLSERRRSLLTFIVCFFLSAKKESGYLWKTGCQNCTLRKFNLGLHYQVFIRGAHCEKFYRLAQPPKVQSGGKASLGGQPAESVVAENPSSCRSQTSGQGSTPLMWLPTPFTDGPPGQPNESVLAAPMPRSLPHGPTVQRGHEKL